MAEENNMLMRRVTQDTLMIIEDLKVYFPLRRGIIETLTFKPPRYVRAVDGVSFDIRRKEIFCLVGESGCGKTTTGKALLRLVPIHGGAILFKPKDETLKELNSIGIKDKDGFVDLAGIKLKHFKPLRKEIQMIYQDPFGSLNPRFTVKNIVEEPLIIHKLASTSSEREELVAKTLEAVRLIPPEEFMNRYPHQLSGGQRQRVAVARALILNPSFIVADEPVSMLDVSIRAEILELLLNLRDKYGLTFLFITHDLAVARYICDRIAVMYLGKIVELADGRELIENPQHPYTKALVAAIPEPDPSNKKKIRKVPIKGEVPSAVNIPPGCRFHPRCLAYEEKKEELAELCTKKIPPYYEVSREHYVACWLYRSLSSS